MKLVRRKKRTSAQIEEDITKFALSIIAEKGFTNVTLTEIAKAANVEPSVFYKQYETLGDCLDKLVRKYDYWFSGIVENYKGNVYTEEGYRYILEKLFASFSENKMMQQLIRWELSDINETTLRTSQLREFHTIPLSKEFGKLFQGTQVDIRAVSALVIGGIYYLILHGNLCNFCDINVNNEEGKERIINAILYLSKKIFSELNPDKEKKIAKKLKEKNIDWRIIAECTGLSIDVIEIL